MSVGRIASWFDDSSFRLVLLIIVAAVSAWLLYPRGEELILEDDVQEITLWTLPGPVYESAKILVEEFERRNPQYRVMLGTATVRDVVGDPTRFLMGVAGGTPPDAIMFDRFAIVEWAARGAFTDLSPYIEREAGGAYSIQEENFFHPAWEEPIYQGRNYAIASDADTRALYYNINSLIRAGFVHGEDDPEVLSGEVEIGDARPPKTWEEIITKRLHAIGEVTAEGRVTISDYKRREFLNENIPDNAAPNLIELGVTEDDVLVLVKGKSLFRARVDEVLGPRELQLDLITELPRGTDSVPSDLRSGVDIKIFDKNGYIPRMSRFDSDTGVLTEAAFVPLLGNSWLYLFGWQKGGEFMTEDGKTVTLNDPQIVEALQWLTDVYDAMGGIELVNYIQSSMKMAGEVSAIMDPFLNGSLAMRVDVDFMLRDIMRLKPDLAFGIAPAPLPEEQLEKGVEPFGWGGGWAYAIPSTAENKEAAWELIRWMTSLEGNKILIDFEASLFRSRGQKYIPRLAADKRVLEWQKEKYIDANPEIPETVKDGYQTFADLMPGSRYRPVTPVGQMLWAEHVRATETAINHIKPPYEALTYGNNQVQAALDRYMNPPEGPEVNWTVLIVLYVLGIVLLFGGLLLYQERKHRQIGAPRRKWIEGYVCASPWLIGFIIFGAGPILFSVVISFCNYDVITPARFIGLQNYTALMGYHDDPVTGAVVANDPLFYKSLWNTLYMVLGVPLQIVIGLMIAVLLDTKVRGLTTYRSIYYLPAIVPLVAGFILWVWLFHPGKGMINQFLLDFGVTSPPQWLDDAEWSKPSLILMMLWGVGASMIIWLAGLKDIPASLYEAAEVDGANWLQRFSRVTIPLLTPYILFNLVMGLIAVFQIFEAAYIMTNGGPADSTLFYAYKLFNEAFRYLNMGVASAMAWILFIVVLAITMFQLWFSRKWVHYGG